MTAERVSVTMRLDKRIVEAMDILASRNNRNRTAEVELALIDYVRQYVPDFIPEISPKP